MAYSFHGKDLTCICVPCAERCLQIFRIFWWHDVLQMMGYLKSLPVYISEHYFQIASQLAERLVIFISARLFILSPAVFLLSFELISCNIVLQLFLKHNYKGKHEVNSCGLAACYSSVYLPSVPFQSVQPAPVYHLRTGNLTWKSVTWSTAQRKGVCTCVCVGVICQHQKQVSPLEVTSLWLFKNFLITGPKMPSEPWKKGLSETKTSRRLCWH